MKKTILAMATLLPSFAFSMALDWKGGYRFEYNNIDGLVMGNPHKSKTYVLNQLYLSPTIIAADGVNIFTRFEVFNNNDPRYINSQVGQIWGEGVGTATPSSMDDSNVLSRTQPHNQLMVSQLYLNVNQEFGQLTAGRAPVNFGLGMTYSSGKGPFDHWADVRDLVGYKMVSGNTFLMPMIGKVHEGSLGRGGQVDDQMFHLQYENPEAGSLFGLFYESRKAGVLGNDLPAAAFGGVKKSGFVSQRYNLLMGREFTGFSFKFEAGFYNGDTGIFTPTGREISISSYGIASEMTFGTPSDRTRWVLMVGAASGDNPGTENYEGYVFNRNYDVAMLMFNHPLGREDFFKTCFYRDATKSADESIDEEGISNTFYFSPHIQYAWTDKLTLENAFTWARLNASPIDGLNVDKNVGFEWDISLSYKPHDKIIWLNQLGILLPGAMFKADTKSYEANTAYGFASKAAISF